jgi:sugar phosphate isomerase/epimerase
MKPAAIQLYSLRHQAEQDLFGVLRQVADMGYKGVEFVSLHNHTPKEIREVLDDLGLVATSQHVDVPNKDNIQQAVDIAKTLGYDKLIAGKWTDSWETVDQIGMVAEEFQEGAELLEPHGLQLGYHNHWFEFSDSLNGTRIFDLMMKNIDFDKVAMQLDMGNMYIGGAKAADVLNQYPGKFELIHVKDEIPSTNEEKYESAVLGKGIINSKEATDLGRKLGGTKIFIVEQEAYQNMSPLQAVKEDYSVMKQWGF